jgi:MFS transporter, DHA1 family, inner membrane transport protein
MPRAHDSGLVLAAGFGYTAPTAAGALLAAIALVVLTGSVSRNDDSSTTST